MKSHGFAPAARVDARVLILGSLPGVTSLEKQEYYAQPHNAFWRIMGELAGAYPHLPYPARLQLLNENHIALWDVCKAAQRTGSLDSAIIGASVEPNDFEAFLTAHPSIGHIFFNGAKAAGLYNRTVLPKLSPQLQSMPVTLLPSTSPAHAAMPFEQKLARWRKALGEHSIGISQARSR